MTVDDAASVYAYALVFGLLLGVVALAFVEWRKP
jgi:hypothetical protein